MKKLAFVLSGGSAMGIFQAGVYEVLLNQPLFSEPEIFSGTSAGAINSSLIAYGYKPQELCLFWEEVGKVFYPEIIKQSFLNIITRPFQHLFGHNYNYFFNTQQLRKLLVKYFKGEQLPLLEKTVILNMVDAKKGAVIRISNKKIEKPNYIFEPNLSVDSILASASIPALFNPVSKFNTLLWDGGLLVNTPLAPAIDFGATTIVPVLCSIPEYEADISSIGNALGQAVNIILDRSYNLDRKLLLHKNKLAHLGEAKYQPIDLYTPIRPDSTDNLSAWASFNFTQKKLASFYEIGKNEGLKWLKKPQLDEPV